MHPISSQAGKWACRWSTCGLALLALVFVPPASGQPANDFCSGATLIPSIPFTDMVDTTTATSDPNDPSLGCNGSGAQTDGNTVWYVWTPSEDITVNISTDGSTEPGGDPLDTAHGVFTGTCEALTEVACVDVGLTDNLVFEATGGVTYYLKFGEFLDGVGGGNLVVTVDVPPPPEQVILESVRDGISPPLLSLAAVAAERSILEATPQPPRLEEVPMFMRDPDGVASESAAVLSMNAGLASQGGSAMSRQKGPMSSGSRATSNIELLQIFDGADNDDNAFQAGVILAPPDTDGDVGLNHYVQMTNVVTTIYDKGGNIVLGPFPNNLAWTGLGGICESTNRGDPIVLYDEEWDRWLLSQFAFDGAFTTFSLCVALSVDGDPTGAYYQHEFDFTDIGFPDYPKYGFVTDAIAFMVNLFVPFQGAALGAIDKAEAFSPLPTTMIFFKLGSNEFGFVVGDNDGPVFDNMPPTFFTSNGGSGSRIDVWEMAPDFMVPANSTIAEVSKIDVTPFDADLCPAFRERCIDQPGSGTGDFPDNITFLEAIPDRLMHRLQLRDYGLDKRAVTNQTVDADGTGKAGIRWYEFRNHKDRGWTLKKENTFSPDGDHRWMGSVATTVRGETCLGYSISSSTTYTSIGVAARRGRSQIMNVPELVVYDGNVDQFVQRRTSRWGDYSAMAVDPVDDSCWYTQEHAYPNSFIGEQFGWGTKIIQFELKGD